MKPIIYYQSASRIIQQGLSFIKKKGMPYLFIFVLCFHSWNTEAQTTLTAGDLAVVGLNSANPDMFSFVFLKPVTANTVIHFTDNGFTSATTTRTGEGFLTYTAPTNLVAGSMITWYNSMALAGTGFSSNSPSGFAFNGSGDQLFIFQGSTSNWSTLNGITLLYGINYGAALSITSNASNTVQPSSSILPITSFLNIPASMNANGYFANGNVSQTSVSMSGTQSMLLTAMLDAGKWVGTSAVPSTFPSYNITVEVPTISITGSLNQVSTTYGTASSNPASYTVSGNHLSQDILISAPPGFEISKTSSTDGFSVSQQLNPAGGIVANTTIYVRLSATATVAGSPYSGDIVHTSSGALQKEISTVPSAVSPRTLMVNGATAQHKMYDGFNAAVITGATAVGIVNGDILTIQGGGTFATIYAGSGISVTAALTLSGTNASSYTLNQPTGLSANITPASQIVSFSMNTNTNVLSSPLTLNGTATSGLSVIYASSNTSVATINGNTLTLLTSGTTIITASQPGDSNFQSAVPVQITLTVNQPNITEGIFPRYIQGMNGENSNRLPFAAFITLDHLNVNTTYRYFSGMLSSGDSSNSNGEGYSIYPEVTGFNISGAPNLSTSGHYGTFNTDSNGTYSGWFALEPNDASCFTPGNDVHLRIMLNDGNGGDTVAIRLTTTSTVKVINLEQGPGSDKGSGLRGNSFATAKNFIVVYDEVSGTERPIAATFVESDGTFNTTGNSYATFYSTHVESVNGAYGMIIPNDNNKGIRRIEQRSLLTGNVVGCPAIDADGIWPGGGNTIYPTSGTSPVIITTGDAALHAACSSSSSSIHISSCNTYVWLANGQTYSNSGTYTHTTTNWCGCDSTTTLHLTIISSTSNSTSITTCGTYIWPANGQAYSTGGMYINVSTNSAGCSHTDTLLLSMNNSVSGSSQHNGCDMLSVDSMIYLFSGYHSRIYTTSGGCDSVHTYNVSIYYSNSGGSVHTACNTLTMNGLTYNTSGTFPLTYTNATGCDSVHNYYVIIHQSDESSSQLAVCNTITIEGQTFSSAGSYPITYTNRNGCDSIHTYHISVASGNTGSSNHVACDGVTIDDVYYNSSGFHTHNYTNSSGCDSIHTYQVLIHYSNTGGSLHSACNTLNIDGQIYNTTGSYPVTLTNTSGCDSLHTYYVSIKYSNTGWSSHSACNSLQIGGLTFTNSGNDQVTYSNQDGCDSVHTYLVSINYSNNGSTSHTGCDALIIDGIHYTSDGSHTHIYSNQQGCDSVHTYDVSIYYSNSGNSTHMACDELTVGSVTYTLSGTHLENYTNTVGCDSLHSYQVFIHFSNSGSSNHTACEELEVDGMTYTSSGSHAQGYLNEYGCDSLHTYDVIIHNPSSNNTTLVACDSYTWLVNGLTYTVSGTYTDSSSNMQGCLHTENLNLTIHTSTSNSTTATACDSLVWLVNGVSYSSGGIKTNTSTNAMGCLHIDTLHLTLHYSTSGTTSVTVCNQFVWSGPLGNGNTYSTSNNMAMSTSTNAAGCLHTETLNLTVLQSTISSVGISACNSYTWSCNGLTYTQSGTYTCVTTNAAGCSQINTLHLTIHYSTNSTVNVSACNSYIWPCNGQYLTQSGTYNCSGINSLGCTQTTTLNLTIHSTTTSTHNAIACNSYTWSCNGQTYTQSGTYSCVSTNSSGCPHISILALTINQNTTANIGMSACSSYIWACNGQTYNQSGVYTCVTTNTSGCTHLSTLYLTMNTGTNTNVNIAACNSYTWSCNGQTYTQSGTYICSGTNPAGCLQTTTLNLQVNAATSSTMQVTACNSYIWDCNGQAYSQSGTYTCINTNQAGCVHISILNLTIYQSSSATIGLSACTSYTWGCSGQTYTQSGIYTCVSMNAAGCSHVNTLNLTIKPVPTVAAYDVTACGGTAVALVGTPSGGSYSLSNPYTGNATSYTYFYTGSNGCIGSATGSITYANMGAISNVTATNLTSSSATLTWQGHGIWFDIRYKALTSTSWIMATSTSSFSKLITSLNGSTTYTVEVRSYCDRNSSPSVWVGTSFVTTTAAACVTPIPGTTTNITKNSARLNWSHPGVSYYTIRYKLATSSSWINAGTSNATTKNLSGLLANSLYEYQVKAVCTNSYTSGWGNSGYFSTLVSKNEMDTEMPVSDAEVVIFPNPTQDELKIVFHADGLSTTVLSLHDMSGRKVQTVQMNTISGNNELTMSLGEIANGVYFLQIVRDDQMIHKRRVVKH